MSASESRPSPPSASAVSSTISPERGDQIEQHLGVIVLEDELGDEHFGTVARLLRFLDARVC